MSKPAPTTSTHARALPIQQERCESMRAVALARAAIGVLQSVVELDAGNLEGREKAEEDACENGDQRGEADDGEIHVYIGEERMLMEVKCARTRCT